MTDPRVPMRQPAVAAILAFLIPGAGHFYQRRFIKGCVYSACILGTFLGGMALGDWQPVYYRMDSRHAHYGYFSQAMVGLPSMPALIQKSRFVAQNESIAAGRDRNDLIEDGVDAEFTGLLQSTTPGDSAADNVSGRISLKPVDTPLGPDVRGEFTGTGGGSEPVRLTLHGIHSSEHAIYPSPKRKIRCNVVDENGRAVGELKGTIPRAIQDWYQVPLDDRSLERLHGTLGKQFDLAAVYTWIAGLLNVLAIWDALEGPAYGYGDEEDDEESDESQEPDAAASTTDQSSSGEADQPQKND